MPLHRAERCSSKSRRGRWTRAAAVLSAVATMSCLVAPPATTAEEPPAAASAVVPIDWSAFNGPQPSDPASVRLREVLNNSNRYALTTWWQSKGYASQTGPYLVLGALAGPAYEAFALSVSLATGAYDAESTGVPAEDAREATMKLIRSIAADHRVNRASGGWGDGWQDALWAANLGYAGWLMWDHLSAEDAESVRRVVEYEANRFPDYEVPYYRDESGAVIRSGDTAAEENAWNAMLLQVATAMMPDHPLWDRWMDKNLELMVSAFSRPEDVDDRTRVNGKRLETWLRGSNIESDGTLINHNRIHPDYMTTLTFNLMASAAYSLAGQPTPRAALLNADVVYDAMVDHEFASPPYRAPGGTMYVDGQPGIYFPQGTDWSPSRIMIYGELDVAARVYGFDDLASQKAGYWEDLHVGAALAQQNRHPDGKMFAPGEFTSEENDGAVVPARAWLANWLASHDAVAFTNAAYPVSAVNDAPGRLALAVPAELETGVAHEIETVVENRSDLHQLASVDVTLETPDSWTVRPVGASEFHRVRPGERLTTTWEVTVPANATPGPQEVTAQATYVARGYAKTADASAQTWVAPQGRIPNSQLTVTASDAQSGFPASNVIDNDLSTIWHSQYRPPVPPPHSLTLNLHDSYDVTRLYYQPRAGSPNGTITEYAVLASADGVAFHEVTSGTWPLDDTVKTAEFSAPGARHLRLEARAGGGGYASAAELVVVGQPTPVVIESFEANPHVLDNPGDPTSVAVTVSNRGEADVSGEVELGLPQGWAADSTSAPYSLTPGARQTLTFTVTAPATAVPGEIGVSVSYGDGLSIGDTTRVTWSLIDWMFDVDGDAQGWAAANQLSDVAVRDGELAGTATGGDPYFVYQAPLDVDLTAGAVVEVTMTSSGPSTGQLFWSTSAAPGFAEARSRKFTVAGAAGERFQLVIPAQATTLTGLRLDPRAAPGTFEIDSIRLLR